MVILYNAKEKLMQFCCRTHLKNYNALLNMHQDMEDFAEIQDGLDTDDFNDDHIN